MTRREKIAVALPIIVGVAVLLLCITLSIGCTPDQTDGVVAGAQGVHDIAAGPVGKTVEAIAPVAAPFIRLVDAGAIAVIAIAGAWGEFQRRRAVRAVAGATSIVSAVEPILNEASKEGIRSRMSDAGKVLVRKIKGKA